METNERILAELVRIRELLERQQPKPTYETKQDKESAKIETKEENKKDV